MADRPDIITIAGDIGGGKSTVARLLAQQLGIETISTGAIQRSIAAAQGKTSLELNRASERDPSVDRQIDDFLVSLNGRRDPLIVESRMAWHFVTTAFKIYLFCLAEKAADRIWTENRVDEAYATHADALDKTLQRRASEVSRYRSLYGVDIENIRNYDLVVDTTYITPAEVSALIRQRMIPRPRPAAWIASRTLIPTLSFSMLDKAMLDNTAATLGTAALAPVTPISALFVARKFYIHKGHETVAAAFRAGIGTLPVHITAIDDEAFESGMSARNHIRAVKRAEHCNEWQQANGFTYDFDVGAADR